MEDEQVNSMDAKKLTGLRPAFKKEVRATLFPLSVRHAYMRIPC